MRKTLPAILIFVLCGMPLWAQDASRGIAMPFTVTGGLLVSNRPKADDPDASRRLPGFRAILYPGLRLSPKWSLQSAVDIKSEPFYPYEDFYAERDVEARVLRVFVAYRWTGENSSVEFKAGKLNSAFGSFPLRYSDTVNPLIDQPFGYSYAVKLRPDQSPCGTADLVHQVTYATYVHHYCGGSTADRAGMAPVTLYGLPGTELSTSWRKLDSRIQLTNSSPANPQDLRSSSQHLQWTAGAGYTIRQGFRVGASFFQGPFLEDAVRALLPSVTDIRDFPATGMGTDLKWGRGRWNANAEWNRVEFRYPRFSSPPAISSGYVEVKAALNPAMYAAVRVAVERHSRVKDAAGITVDRFLPNRESYEFGIGYRLNRSQILKTSYEWFKTDGVAGNRNNVFAIQFVTSIHALSKSY